MTPREALRFLRAHRTGVLLAGERPWRARFCACPREGWLAMFVDHAAMDADEHLLFTPDETRGSMQLLLAAREGEPREELRDRWMILHGSSVSGMPRFAGFDIETARLGRDVFDGEDLMAPNPLVDAEPALTARANTDRARLARACEAALEVRLDDAICAAIDPDGLSIRHKLGVIRLPFDEPAESAPEAERALDALLRRGGAA